MQAAQPQTVNHPPLFTSPDDARANYFLRFCELNDGGHRICPKLSSDHCGGADTPAELDRYASRDAPVRAGSSIRPRKPLGNIGVDRAGIPLIQRRRDLGRNRERDAGGTTFSEVQADGI
jgi:hypothetical protein